MRRRIFSTRYSLGNVIGHIYKYRYGIKPIENPFHLTKNHKGKFGHFITHEYKGIMEPFDDDSFLREKWWFDEPKMYRLAHPNFTKWLRDAVSQYKGWKDPELSNTCVIHFRVGDFLIENRHITPEIFVEKLDRLPNIPDTFQILNSGTFHVDYMPHNKSDSIRILEDLRDRIKEKFPQSIVEFVNGTPDEDFYRMIQAPMLVTSVGSFATMAACANENYRLTPSFGSLSTVRDVEIGNVFENWETYAL